MSLKNYLAGLSKEQLIGQILELTKKFREVKSFYEFSLNPDVSKKKEEVKFLILQSLYPTGSSFKLKLKDARKAISDFRKLSPDEESLVDVMLYFVECGVTFTNDFGDVDEAFYNSIGGMFRDAGKLCETARLQKLFKERAEKIVNDTTDIGWGFHEEVEDIFFNFFVK